MFLKKSLFFNKRVWKTVKKVQATVCFFKKAKPFFGQKYYLAFKFLSQKPPKARLILLVNF
jgi:hypothetical protein